MLGLVCARDVEVSAARYAGHVKLTVCLLVSCLWMACGDELGECDRPAAKQLVYGRNGLVATKGQALLHDSCGNAAFCHSSKAEGKDRYGAPSGLDFDTLPSPIHWPKVVDHRAEIWSAVLDGTMPPDGVGLRVVGNNEWSFDPERRDASERLGPLTSKEGKGALRNWLACGAPVVTETEIPVWAQPGTDGGVLSDWGPIFTQVMRPKCATAGCHNSKSAGDLVLLDECEAYAQLLDKLESKQPACGAPMPPAGPLPEVELRAIRDWVEGGAPAANCK